MRRSGPSPCPPLPELLRRHLPEERSRAPVEMGLAQRLLSAESSGTSAARWPCGAEPSRLGRPLTPDTLSDVGQAAVVGINPDKARKASSRPILRARDDSNVRPRFRRPSNKDGNYWKLLMQARWWSLHGRFPGLTGIRSIHELVSMLGYR
jgi:hypothetical protein